MAAKQKMKKRSVSFAVLHLAFYWKLCLVIHCPAVDSDMSVEDLERK